MEQCLGFSCVPNGGHKFAVVSRNLNKMWGGQGGQKNVSLSLLASSRHFGSMQDA